MTVDFVPGADDLLPVRCRYAEQRKADNRKRANERQKTRRLSKHGGSEEAKKAAVTNHREWREKQIAAGLCTLCTEPAVPGYKMCEKHVEISRSKRRLRKEAGVCASCNNPVVPGSRLCERHIKKRKAHERWVQANAEKGLCKKCRENLADAGYKTCKPCRDETNAYKKEREAKALAAGNCIVCHNPALAGAKWCDRCYFKRIAREHGLRTADWPELAAKWERQDARCAYSGVSLALGVSASLDHILPVSKGGTSRLDNLHWIHRDVNQMKRDLLEADFLRFVRLIASHRHLISE